MSTARTPALSSSVPLLLAVVALMSGCTQQNVRPPNVVILFADDLGYGDLSSYGHPTIETPRLDLLADEGLRFTSFYAGAPSCTPSRAALLTGRYGLRVGLPVVLMPSSTGGLPDDEVTIAEVLGEAGYATMAIGKWHVGHTRSSQLPLAQGFDHYFGLPYSHDMIRPFVDTDSLLRYRRDDEILDESVHAHELTVRYTGEAENFIASQGDHPFLLYLAYSMPHLPIAAPDSMLGRSRAGLYGDVIQMIDWSVGRVLDALEATGVAGRTIVVFTSDNGPWLNLPDRMLADGVVRWDAGSPGPLRGWKGTTYEGGERVPAIFRWPNVIPPGTVTAEPASVLDLLPTVAAAAGARMPEDRVIDGRDIGDLLRGTGRTIPRPFLYISDGRIEAIRVGRWKLRQSWQLHPDPEPDSAAPLELFDLEVDPMERFDRAGELPDTTLRLAGMLLAARDSLGAR